ncbi:hypothetical protein TTHERM_00142470 (macronuclear) [Tetrahymena thermophila SB210]|uniref:Transmembrane protein n=1 Tax=Tetrahymena thermophila (strain SB210) TaxID=312017 RepID=I7M7A1_TETTS|nr:hypothetical protein TTHERM_00142470 [Tetrahymena thermophila SB210]EAR90840.2 hypothetical protein TTHERM_00142470 [Tetrahymena thermophila SB210]|eukprot:XP_001011085.2 hypothetical protein TTHERM_00142470 [Tetrahymena thermophila SB210]
MSFFEKQNMSQAQYFQELQQIILSVPQVSIKQYLEQKQMFGKDVSLFYDEIEYLKQAETSILQLKDIAVYLGNKVVEVRKQHYEEIEFLEAEIMQAKEEIQEQKQKLQEYYQIYQNMEEKNIQYQKQNFELEEQCDKHLQRLTTLYQTMEVLAEQQRMQNQNQTKKNAYVSMQQINDELVINNLNHSISLQTLGNIQQIDEQFNFNCNSCTEKQVMIESLQQEIDEISSEKKNLKEQVYTLKSQLEVLKKRNVDLEKQCDNVAVLEKYSSVQKQRLKIQQNKAQLQQQYLNSTDKGLSPSSASINTNILDDDHFLHTQNGNYQSLLEELNQIKLRSMNINMQTLTEFNNSIQQDMNSFSDFCSTNNEISKKILEADPVSSFNYEINQPNNSSQQNKIADQLNQQQNIKIITSSEKNSPHQSREPRLSLFKRNMINDDTNLQYSNKPATNSINVNARIRKSDSIYQYKSPDQKREFYGHLKHVKREYTNSQPNKMPSQNLINSIDEKNESISSNKTNKNQSEFSSFVNVNSFNERGINQLFSNGSSTHNNIIAQNQLEQQPSNNQILSICELKSNSKHNKKRSELKFQQPLFDDLKSLMSIQDQQSFASLNINSQKGTFNEFYHKEEIKNKHANQYGEEVEEEEEEKKDFLNSDQYMQSFEGSQELRSHSDFNSMDEMDQTKKSISQLNTEQIIQDTDQNSLKFIKNFEQITSGQNTQSISANNTNEQLEEKIQNNINSDSLLKLESTQTLKCIILPLPKKTRSLFFKIIQWLIFLFLIPISFIFEKPSFLKEMKQKQ